MKVDFDESGSDESGSDENGFLMKLIARLGSRAVV